VESLGVKFSGERSPLALTAGAWAQQWLEHVSLWVHSIGAARLAGAALPELDGRRLVSIAANSLQGAAATWYRQQRATTWAGAVPAWEAFVDALQLQFPDPHPLLTLQAVTNLKQSGTVEAYLQYATKVDGQTPDVPRLHKVKCFLNGLRDSQLQNKGLEKFLKHPEWQLADAIQWVSEKAMAAQLVANQQKHARSQGGPSTPCWGSSRAALPSQAAMLVATQTTGSGIAQMLLRRSSGWRSRRSSGASSGRGKGPALWRGATPNPRHRPA
jgi:hypothetical protein